MLTLAYAALLLHPATITYTCTATKLEKVVAAISIKTGEPLKVTAALGNQFIVVRFKDTPVEDALDQISKVVDGKWVESGGIRFLQTGVVAGVGRKDKELREAVRKYLAPDPASAQWTAKEADKFVVDALAFNDLADQAPDRWQKIQALEAQGPQKRLLRRLAQMIGERDFLNLTERNRAVYSTNPTQMQRPLPASAQIAIAQFVRESTIQQEALRKKGFDQSNRPEMNYYMEALEPRAEAMTGYDRAMLSIQRTMGSISLNLILRSKDGSQMRSSNDDIRPPQNFQPDPKKTNLKVEGEFKPSEESKLLGRAMAASMGGRRTGTPLTPEESSQVKAIFSDLETNELLSYLPSEALLQTAEALNRDLVASMSDIAIMTFAVSAMTEKPTLQGFFNQGMCPWEIIPDDNGLTLKSIDDMFGFNINLPRRQMSKFTKDVIKSGLTIDALADLVVATSQNEASQTILLFACIPFPGLINGQSIYEGQAALRAYGMLDALSRVKAKGNGFTTTFRTLTPALQNSVSDYIYNETKSIAPQPANIDQAHTFYPGMGIDNDSTTVFPNGMPPNTEVTFRVRDIDSLFMVNTYEGGDTNTQATTEDNAANQLAWAEKSRGTPDYRQETKLATGILKQLDMVIKFSEKVSNHSRFRLNPVFGDKDLKEIKDLPEARRKALEEKLAKSREQFKDYKVGPSRPTKIKP